MNSYADLIYENIPSNNKDYTFGWGRLGEFKVIIMDNGYINATELCKNGGKQYKHWKELEGSNRYIKYLQDNAVMSTLPLIEIRTNDGSGVRGTYACEDLIIDIASWISFDFKHKVAKIIRDFYVREYREQIRAKDTRIDELLFEVKAVRVELQEREKKLDEQVKLAADQSAQIAELLGYAKTTTSKLDETNSKLDETTSKLDETNSKLEVTSFSLKETTSKLDTTNSLLSVTNTRLSTVLTFASVPASNPKKAEIFVLIRLAKTSKPDFNHYVLRGKTDYVNSKLASFEGKQLLNFVCSPNAQTIFDRLKELLEHKIKFHQNYISLVSFSETRLIRFINGIHSDCSKAYLKDMSKEEALKLVKKSELRSWCRQHNISDFAGLSSQGILDLISKC